MTSYAHPRGVDLLVLDGRPVLTTAQSGRVVVDRHLADLWQAAHGHSLEEVLARCEGEGDRADEVRAALACLVAAGLLDRGDSVPAVSEREAPRPVSGSVAVIVVGFNSLKWLAGCLDSLKLQSHAPVEILFVDNGSGDGSMEWVANHTREVLRLRLDSAGSLASAINQGAARTRGEFLLLLNPDVTLDPDAIAHLVAVASGDAKCAAVAGKLRLAWAPAFLYGLGNHVGAASWGADNGLGHLDLGQFDAWQQVPSACFACALIRREAWETIGPLDEGFPLYYEDSEWCYRARLLGFTVRAAPRALGYHDFGGGPPGAGAERLSAGKLENVTLGRLRFALKLLEPGPRARFLLNYLGEDLVRLLWGGVRGNGASVRAQGRAWARLWRGLPQLQGERRDLQARRRMRDRELFALQRAVPAALMWRGMPELTWDGIRTHYLPILQARGVNSSAEVAARHRPRLVVVCNERIGLNMAGMAARSVNLAQALANDLEVTLAAPAGSRLPEAGPGLVEFGDHTPNALHDAVIRGDVVLVSGNALERFPFLRETSTRMVVDLYDPFFLENLFYYRGQSLGDRQVLNQHALEVAGGLAQRGDFFLCASERQRDFWLGFLAASGRVNPQTTDHDPSLRTLIDVVGMGLPERAPRPGAVLRGLQPGFPDVCKIVLWGGGLWDWLDPLTLLRAWPEVQEQHPEARLVFLGTRHPQEEVPRHAVVQEAQELAQALGELERTVFFREWIGYVEREGLLLEADVGVVLHQAHVETRFSLRTRVLDYIWARLPILVSEGDVTSEWVKAYGLGQVVPPDDPPAVAQALSRLLEIPRSRWSAGFEAAAADFAWPRVVAPLRSYCLAGSPAPDHAARSHLVQSAPRARRYAARARFILRNEGLGSLLRRALRHVRWRLAR